ncbi:MAG: S26 family signal peptidase [Thermoguttaceae bacterium]
MRHALKRSAPRKIVETALCALIALLLIRSWFVAGLFIPCRIVSGSMATTLLGTHREVVCADCGFKFPCDSALLPVSPRAVCPNCGYAKNDLESATDLGGDRVLIDRLAFYRRQPRRWELAAFRRPPDVEKILLKRIVGLPGESVEIQRGDVYINGQIQRKTLDEQLAMALLVFDADYQPTLHRNLPPRWKVVQKNSRWRSLDGRFTHPNNGADASQGIDWLMYRHWRRLPGNQNQTEKYPITDLIGYNQTLPRREEDIHVVNDLMLSFRISKIFGKGDLYIRCTLGNNVFLLQIDPLTARFQLRVDDREINCPQTHSPFALCGRKIVVSTFDQQLLLAFGGQTMLCVPLDHPLSSERPSSQEFALGLRGLGIAIDKLKIFRDVYFNHPIGVAKRAGIDCPLKLGEAEYFVLGDNSPVAEDSRTWTKPATIDETLLLGKPFFVLSSAKSLYIGPWHFQVPDLSRMRYIH